MPNTSGSGSEGAASPRNLRILLVDDDADGSELLAEILRKAGHDVRVAADPAAALQEVEAFRPELAIVDIGLPLMNGYELARQIRVIAPCTLFALSGYGAHTAPADNVVSSFDQHLMKPLNTAALLQAIARLG